ncbi:VanZ family protein [Paenibacillus thalictri]|uniref:VanZ family protein n=1 Tax=Paenibacillus thalictri TaxID=2527873 RepID=UPI0013EF1A7C|nr:VanZ family protein [Paenibacillus thalictri]
MRLNKLLAWIVFIGYSACLLYWMFLGFHRGEQTAAELRYNLIPFRTIERYFVHFNAFQFEMWVINIVGNIGVFVPFGWLMPYIFKGCERFWKFSFIFIAAIVALELLQTFLRVGSGDVDDVILNYLGAAIGYLLYSVFRWRQDRIVRVEL